MIDVSYFLFSQRYARLSFFSSDIGSVEAGHPNILLKISMGYFHLVFDIDVICFCNAGWVIASF